MHLKGQEMLEQQKTKKGFTIIEVVLVLAIAGLIFLMVFLALPNLQRSQKDTQRRDDLARFQTAITNYQSNNRGKLPGTSANQESTAKDAYNDFIDNYLRVNGDSFNDPDGQPYSLSAGVSPSAPPTAVQASASAQLFAVSYSSSSQWWRWLLLLVYS